MANLIVGVLDGSYYLVAVSQLDKTNNLTITRFVNDSLSGLYLPAVPHEKILMMVTDAATYMIKTGENLKIFFPNLFHLTCVAYGINRVTEAVRTEYLLVNRLINNVKKKFKALPRQSPTSPSCNYKVGYMVRSGPILRKPF
jgi:hypothetical protein